VRAFSCALRLTNVRAISPVISPAALPSKPGRNTPTEMLIQAHAREPEWRRVFQEINSGFGIQVRLPDPHFKLHQAECLIFTQSCDTRLCESFQDIPSK
jgi:hypothetical protein